MSPVDIQKIDGVIVLRPIGTGDLSLQLTREDMTGFVENNSEALPMVVNLESIRILQSSGVGLLFHFLTLAEKNQIRVGFINATELVGKVLDVAGVEHLAQVYKDLNEARAALLG